MPCRDYSDDVRVIDNTQTYKEIRDKLARIACKAMTRLEELGYPLLDQESVTWFTQHKIDDAKAEKARKKLEAETAERKRKELESKRQAELATLKKLQAKYGRNV